MPAGVPTKARTCTSADKHSPPKHASWQWRRLGGYPALGRSGNRRGLYFHLLAPVRAGSSQGLDVLDELPELGELVVRQIKPLDINYDRDGASMAQ